MLIFVRSTLAKLIGTNDSFYLSGIHIRKEAQKEDRCFFLLFQKNARFFKKKTKCILYINKPLTKKYTYTAEPCLLFVHLGMIYSHINNLFNADMVYYLWLIQNLLIFG